MAISAAHRLAQIFERVFDEANTAIFERFIIWLAIVGFAVHVNLIFLARLLDPTPLFLAALDVNYLSALYTPFSFILFYEVLLLILLIPQSTTGSLGKQYEIISLIVIRNVFKDIAEFDSFQVVEEQTKEFLALLVDMGGGLLLFLLVAVFYHIRRWQTPASATDRATPIPPSLEVFIIRKKAVALMLAAFLFALAAYNFGRWLIEAYQVAVLGASPVIDIKTIFYVDVFTVMIFTDVLILLLSMFRTGDYKLVFRNAGFIISTILIRFSLTIEKPYDVELALLATLFGVLVLSVYGYFRRFVEAGGELRSVESAP